MESSGASAAVSAVKPRIVYQGRKEKKSGAPKTRSQPRVTSLKERSRLNQECVALW
jgi:hypothetical protein